MDGRPTVLHAVQGQNKKEVLALNDLLFQDKNPPIQQSEIKEQ